MAVFGVEEWLRHGEVFSVVFGILARFAPTELRRAEQVQRKRQRQVVALPETMGSSGGADSRCAHDGSEQPPCECAHRKANAFANADKPRGR